MNKPILLIDMDEVIVDFYNHPRYPFAKPYDRSYINSMMAYKVFWTSLLPLAGTLEAVSKLIESDKFDIYIATQPVEDCLESYTGKSKWVKRHLPELSGKLIMTQNKDLLVCDYLIDDNLRWSHGCTGKFIHFNRDVASDTMWNTILNKLLTGEIHA